MQRNNPNNDRPIYRFHFQKAAEQLDYQKQFGSKVYYGITKHGWLYEAAARRYHGIEPTQEDIHRTKNVRPEFIDIYYFEDDVLPEEYGVLSLRGLQRASALGIIQNTDMKRYTAHQKIFNQVIENAIVNVE